MKILFINNFRGEDVYGIELWMLRMSCALRARGHSTQLACRPNGGLWRAAQREKCPVAPYDPGKGLDFAAARQLRRRVQAEEIDVVCLKTYNDLRVAAWACRGLPIRLFCRRGSMHDVKNNLRHFLHLAWLKPEILVPSEALKNEFSRIRWVNPARIHVMHHGLDVDRYQAPEVQSAAKGAVVFLGRLCYDKGIDVLLEAWAAVTKQRPSARLVLVGSGDQTAYQAQAQALGLADRISFAGYQSDVRPWLKGAAAMVLPSRREGAGYVLIEAMAAALPVVASRLECIEEYVEDGQTGFLTPPGDAAALTDALVKILSDEGLARRMGEAGLNRVRERFSLEATVQRMESILAGTAACPQSSA